MFPSLRLYVLHILFESPCSTFSMCQNANKMSLLMCRVGVGDRVHEGGVVRCDVMI